MISVVQLGTVDYAAGLKLQQTLVDLRHSERIPDLLLLLEHAPVITLGRNANRRNVLAAPELLHREGIEVFETDRGGDVTYHGPGQLVGYPIFNLRGFRLPRPPEDDKAESHHHGGRASGSAASEESQSKSLGAVDYVRRLEEVLIRTCTDFGVATGRVPKLTGVWTQPSGTRSSSPGPDGFSGHEAGPPAVQAKIAAIGVHISRGITSHGFAFNVNTNLNHFGLIVPCGIATKPVTSLSEEKGAPVSLDAVAQSVARNFGRVFNSQILWVETLDALLGRSVGVPLKVPKEFRQLHGDETFWA